MDKRIIEFYKQTSQFTDCGKFKKELVHLWRKKCKKSLKLLMFHMQQTTIHRAIYQMYLSGNTAISVYGDFSHTDFTTPMSEDDIFITASAMLNEIFRRDKKGFYSGRPVNNRINVTCRYVSVLTSAVMKANGYACRCRPLWANYFEEGKFLDHWVNEFWNEKEGRWVMFDTDDLYDPEYMQHEIYEKTKFTEHYMDMGHEYYKTAAEMWFEIRKDQNLVKSLVIGSSPAKLEDVVKYLFFDFHAVMNQEVTFTFIPFAYDKKFESLTKNELEELDELATLMLDVDANFDTLKQKFDSTPKFRMLRSPLVGKGSFKNLIKMNNYQI